MHLTDTKGGKAVASGVGVYERREIKKKNMSGGEGVSVLLRRTVRQDLGRPVHMTIRLFSNSHNVIETSSLDISLCVQFSSSRTLTDGQHVFAVRVDAVVVVRR